MERVEKEVEERLPDVERKVTYSCTREQFVPGPRGSGSLVKFQDLCTGTVREPGPNVKVKKLVDVAVWKYRPVHKNRLSMELHGRALVGHHSLPVKLDWERAERALDEAGKATFSRRLLDARRREVPLELEKILEAHFDRVRSEEGETRLRVGRRSRGVAAEEDLIRAGWMGKPAEQLVAGFLTNVEAATLVRTGRPPWSVDELLQSIAAQRTFSVERSFDVSRYAPAPSVRDADSWPDLLLPDWARRKTLSFGGLHRTTHQEEVGLGFKVRLERPARMESTLDYSLLWGVTGGAESIGGVLLDLEAGIALGTRLGGFRGWLSLAAMGNGFGVPATAGNELDLRLTYAVGPAIEVQLGRVILMASARSVGSGPRGEELRFAGALRWQRTTLGELGLELELREMEDERMIGLALSYFVSDRY